MNKNRGFTPLAVVLMLSGNLVLTGCDDKQTQQGSQWMSIAGVVMVKAEPLQVTTELPDCTNAYRIAEVRPQVSGIILRHNLEEGSDTEADVSLYQISPTTHQAVYGSAEGDLTKAQAAANIAQLTVNRYQKLLGTQYISKQEYNQALTDAQQANTAVAVTKTAVETARINLAYTRVTSPISGRIGKSNVIEGALVQNGQATTLAAMQQLDPIYVDVTQSSNDFLRLKQELANGTLKQENGRAEVSLITSDGIKFPQDGTLELSDVTVDQAIGSIILRAIFPNPDHTLLPGVFVRVRLEEGLSPSAILVSRQGVTRAPRGNTTVLVVDADDRVETRPIVVSQAIDGRWLATEGLKAGDRIAISGLQKVRPGVQTKAQEVTADSNQQTVNGAQPEQPEP